MVISSTAPQLSEALVNGVCTSPVPQENLKSDLEGEYVELTEVSLPRFGPQTGSLTQSLALNSLTQPRTRVNASKGKHRFIVIQDSTYSKNIVQSALMQKEHCQTDPLRMSSAEVLKNVIPLESSKLAHGELSPGQLIPGGPRNMGNSFPGAEFPVCSAEDSSAEQEICSEHSVDLRYALCSYSSVCAGGRVSCKAQMPGAPGNMERESDSPSGNAGVEISEQSPETIVDATAAEEEMMVGAHGEPVTEGQDEVAQICVSSISVSGSLGSHCTLKKGSDIFCQSRSESVAPAQATTLLITPEGSDVDVEGCSPSGNTADVEVVGVCFSDQEANLSSPLNPPEQNQREVDEFELGRQDSPEEVKEAEQILTANGSQTSQSHCSEEAPTDGLLSGGEEQKVSTCWHKEAEEVTLLQAALSAEGDQMAAQLKSSDTLMGFDAQAEGSGQSRTQRSGGECEEPQGRAESHSCKGEKNFVLNPEHVTVQDLQEGEENQESFSCGEKSTIPLKTLESIEEELEVGPLLAGPTKGHMESTILHFHQEAASGASRPEGTAIGCECVCLFDNMGRKQSLQEALLTSVSAGRLWANSTN